MRNYDLSNPVHIIRCVARERYAWPGGYELFVVTTDGGLICSGCVREEYRNILDSTKKGIRDGWCVMGITNESELELYEDFCSLCSHCNKKMGY
jgi:hypothetical protein